MRLGESCSVLTNSQGCQRGCLLASIHSTASFPPTCQRTAVLHGDGSREA